MSGSEAIERFRCFACDCGVYVVGDTPARSAAVAARAAREELLSYHDRFSRFIADSELSRLNRDPRTTVPVGPLLARLAQAAREAGELTGGLVDATMLTQIEDVGYRGDLGAGLPLRLALALAPPRRPAQAREHAGWSRLVVDERVPAVSRPPGVALDSGGLAKGLLADVLAAGLSAHDSFAIDCGGDIAIGGSAGVDRPVDVQSPFDGTIIHRFEGHEGGVATSGIGRRSWLGGDGGAAHHLLDPASGRPAFTGVVQASALAPTALLAEIHAKATILSGPEDGLGWLPWGGVLVLDDGSHRVVERSRAAAA